MISNRHLTLAVVLLVLGSTVPATSVAAIASSSGGDGGQSPLLEQVSATATETPTSTATATETPTPTPTATATATETPTPTPTATPEQPPATDKTDPTLSSAVTRLIGQARDPGAVTESSFVTQHTGRTFVTVDVRATPGRASEALARLDSYDGEMRTRVGDRFIARVPADALRGFAASPAISVVDTPNEVSTAAVTSEGVQNVSADAVHAEGITGNDVEVAVIDTGFDASSPEIEDNVVAYDAFDGDGEPWANESGQHGTATAEIVADTAPNVSLHLYRVKYDVDIVSVARDIDENTSVDVVSMSLGLNDGPFDGTSDVDDAIAESVANGTTWFVSSGNSGGGAHYNTTWADANGDGRLNFTASDQRLGISHSTSGPLSLAVSWDDYEDRNEDYDIRVFDAATDQELVNSTNTQAGPNTFQSEEEVSLAAGETKSDMYLVVERADANGSSDFDVFVGDYSTLEYSTDTRSVTRPATEETALAVGAVDYTDLSVRSYSSRGPTIDGDRKPELVGPDGVSSSVYTSSSGFTGTSAAAPHAAGVAALVVEADSTVTPDSMRETLTATADPVTGTEPDNTTGFGLVNASAAVAAVATDTTPPDLSNPGAFDLADGNGEVADGEQVKVNVTVTDATLDTVVADARDFGAGNVTLLDEDTDGVYNATFTVDAATATDGTHQIAITANDTAGNENVTVTNELTLATTDTTAPALAEATASDATVDAPSLADDQGVVGDGDTVRISVGVTDASSVTVTADASPLGGSATLSLTDGDANGVYDGTFTVDATGAGATDGDYTFDVTATDANGNTASTTTNSVTLDTTAPTVSQGTTTSDSQAFPNLVGAGGTVNVSATATDASGVAVTVDVSAIGHDPDELLSDPEGDGVYYGHLAVTESTAEGVFSFTVTATDAAGNTDTTTTDDIRIDVTEPALSTVELVNATDGSATVEPGDDAEIRATASDARLLDVVADASSLGAGTVSLTDGNTDGVYNATVTVSSSGTYQVDVTARDEAGNENSSLSTELTAGSPDTTPPTLSDAGAFDLADGNAEVDDGEQVKVNVTATDAGGLSTVSVDASAFGAGTVSLADPDGDDVYNATFAVDAASAGADGDYALTITATDAAGNANTADTNLVALNTTGSGDTTAPTVSNFGVQMNQTKPLGVQVLFDTDEEATDVEVVVTDDSGTTVETLTESELAGFSFGGGYSYFHEFTLPETGTYTVTLTKAADAAGNDGASNEQVTVRRVVESYHVEHVGGTTPEMANLTQNVYLSQGTGGLLQIQLRDADDADESIQNRTELADIGFASDTRVRIEVTVAGYAPRLLLGTGRNGTYTVTDNGDGTRNLTVEIEPASAQLISSRLSGGGGTWPTGSADTADEAYTSTIDLAADEMTHVGTPNDYNGTMILTDAQELGTPTATTTGSNSDPTLRLYVAGPHNTTEGTLNTGFYETFLPNALLSSWGVTDPAQLQVTAIGSDVSPTRTQTAGGVVLDVPIHYSAGNVDVAGSSSSGSDTTPPSVSNAVLTDATDGNGVVGDGDTLRVAAAVSDPNLQSVTVAATAFGAGSVTLTDGDADGTYDATFTVDDASAGADGDYALTVSATDSATNTNTAVTGSVTLDTTAPAAAAGTDQVDDVDTAVDFDGSASTDANGIASYAWDFGDGASASGATPSHTYTSTGDYTATLTVTDAAGNTASDSLTVTVEPASTVSSGGGGGGGGGGAAPAPAPTTPEPTPDADPTVTTVGDATATVERTDAGVTVSVTDATETDRVELSLPAADVTDRLSTDGVAVESMSTTFARDTDFSAAVSSSPEPPADSTPPIDSAVGYVTVDTGGEFVEADVSEVTFGFAVSATRLEDRDLAPEDVVLYRYHAGEWTELETRFVGDDDEMVRFEADSPGLSTFAIGSRDSLDEAATAGANTGDGPADEDATDASDATDVVVTETATATPPAATASATPGNDEDEPATTTTEGPGFGALAALAALLVAALARRRHD